MENAKKIVVLNELRHISWIITMYNRENFQLSERNKFYRNIGTVLIYTFCLIMYCLVFVTSVWYCFDCSFDVEKSSLAIPICISVVQMNGMYISLALNNRKITQLIHYIQTIIEKSEHFLSKDLPFSQVFKTFWYFLGQFDYSGCESEHAFITKVFFKTMSLTTAVLFAISGLWPILYAICGHPTRNHWMLPLSFQ